MSVQRDSTDRVRVSFSRNSATSALQDSSKHKSTSTDSIDISSLVERYKRLRELLFPFNIVWDASLYVIRWENYPLTLTTTIVLCVLLYYPSLFLACLTLLAICIMAMGKYYSSTKSLSLLKTRIVPNVEQLNHDLQELQHVEREQIISHLLLLEYKQIVQNVEKYFLLITQFLDYLYRIILWKSLKVSLCVTVLLCVCLVLVCILYLRVIACFVPVLLLCLNRHFLSRTVDLWKKAGIVVWSRVRLNQVPANKDSGTFPNNHSGHEGEPAGVEVFTTSVETNDVLCEEREDNTQQEEATTTVPGRDQPSSAPRPNRTNSVSARCTKCRAPFTLIKRRHDCANCGNTFCGSCSVKKKRTFLGATAPAAYESSVRVCNDCRKTLEDINKLEEERRKKEETLSLDTNL